MSIAVTESKSFCILPWVHTYIHTNGDVYPCCISWSPDKKSKIQNISNDSLENIFNSDFLKKLRLDMLNGKSRPDVCTTCYKIEKTGFASIRTRKNDDYKSQIIDLTKKTKSDGFVEPVITSIDFRFSNLCNLKCRTCGPEFSSAWAKEISRIEPVINASTNNEEDILKAQYGKIERISFAGGEPLIMAEHFRTLKNLIDVGRAAEVTLVYNSNVTNLQYQNNDLLSYWKHFKEIIVGASIDAVGDRASYIRHGVKWSVVEKNLHSLMCYGAKQNNFFLYYSPTISIYNADHISDMHRYLWDNNLLPDINKIKFNLIVNGDNFVCNILPKKIKDSVYAKIEETKTWLRNIGAKEATIGQYENLQLFLKQESPPEHLKKFLDLTKTLDKKRNEDFFTVFPEYSELLN